MKRALGVCYYPEHWPQSQWPDDASRMAELGLSWVRIGEFAWSRIEPQPNRFDWEWLDQAIETLGYAGLKIILGTPTATPPRWMIDRHPDMLAVDIDNKPRTFGSRRHYCFSHVGYRQECARIVEILVRRYASHPAVAAWQTDNEYGCHDTTISYSQAACEGFRHWLAEKYDNDISALNRCWGNVFWSMDYQSFDQIDLPNMTVTEANPGHWLDFHRFSSDQVVTFNRLQTEIIRAHTSTPVVHNYMGRETAFDHFAVGEDLEIASWDSYPLGFLEDRINAPTSHKRRFARQGDPDFQAFHHDLYRTVGKGRWWVMEQQPGPVNWAPFNPVPLPGMVRLWSWEAFAHGAELVSFFRWRQARFGQEMLHAGLLRPDGVDTAVIDEIRTVAEEIAALPDVDTNPSPVALIFDYQTAWAWDIQPHAQGASYFDLVFDIYKALRQLGQSIDIVSPQDDLATYKLVLAPGLMIMPDSLKQSVAKLKGAVVLGPRAGARDQNMHIPDPLSPAVAGLNISVTHVESLRPDLPVELGNGGNIINYFEHLSGGSGNVELTVDGAPALVKNDKLYYLAGWPDQTAARRMLKALCHEAGLETIDLPEDVRIRDTVTTRFWFNYGNQTVSFDDLSA